MVPRILNRFHEKIKGNVEQAGFLKRKLFAMALASKMNLLYSKVSTGDLFMQK